MLKSFKLVLNELPTCHSRQCLNGFKNLVYLPFVNGVLNLCWQNVDLMLKHSFLAYFRKKYYIIWKSSNLSTSQFSFKLTQVLRIFGTPNELPYRSLKYIFWTPNKFLNRIYLKHLFHCPNRLPKYIRTKHRIKHKTATFVSKPNF